MRLERGNAMLTSSIRVFYAVSIQFDSRPLLFIRSKG